MSAIRKQSEAPNVGYKARCRRLRRKEDPRQVWTIVEKLHTTTCKTGAVAGRLLAGWSCTGQEDVLVLGPDEVDALAVKGCRGTAAGTGRLTVAEVAEREIRRLITPGPARRDTP